MHDSSICAETASVTAPHASKCRLSPCTSGQHLGAGVGEALVGCADVTTHQALDVVAVPARRLKQPVSHSVSQTVPAEVRRWTVAVTITECGQLSAVPFSAQQ